MTLALSERRWKAIAESQYPWEREALVFVRERLPDHDPYQAWSNFEFVGQDGSIHEVDRLVLSPNGLFLIEIKSRPGTVSGDAGTWTWETDGRTTTVDNPVLLANARRSSSDPCPAAAVRSTRSARRSSRRLCSCRRQASRSNWTTAGGSACGCATRERKGTGRPGPVSSAC